MAAVLFLLSCLSLLIWCVLLFARGGFWRARPAAPLTVAPRVTWPAVAAVVPARHEVDVIGGQVTYGFAEPPPSLPQVQGGKARALAVTAPKRIPELPNVPTLHDEGIDVDVRLWSGLFAPAGTPPDIVKKLEAECMRIAQLPDVKEKLRALSSDAIGNSSAAFTKELEAEIKMWTDVARQAKLSFE